jgi:hypothetical protein
MPILATDIISRMRFALDAEGADHYSDTLDLVPAINSAVDWLIAAVNSAVGDKKFGGELFRELTEARVYRTSEHSRISITSIPWSILAVYINPTTAVTGVAAPTGTADNESEYRVDLYHISSSDSAKRLSIEEWATNVGNPLEAGYEGTKVCDALKSYAYINPIDYRPDSSSIANEIEIRPKVDKGYVTVIEVKKPTKITAVVPITGSIEFPQSAFNIIFNKALQYVAYKQGDETDLHTVTNADLVVLTKLIV